MWNKGYKSKAHCGYSITFFSSEVFGMAISVGIDVSKEKLMIATGSAPRVKL